MAAASGCGGDDNGGGRAGAGGAPDLPASTHADRTRYLAEADRVCRRHQPLREEDVEDLGQAGEAARAQLSVRSALDTDLRRLGAPPELAREVEAFHRKTAEVIALLRQEVVVAEAAGPFTERRTRQFNRLAAQVARTLAERQEVAARIGFRACGALEQGPALSSPAD